MGSELDLHRLQFAFTAVFHYIFPQLTMGLALVIVLLKTFALTMREARYDEAARFWIRIFGLNFAVGVVTGIPMEFQFGTNWARLVEATGGIIGHTLGMEGMFAFFLESTFLGLLVWGEGRLSRRAHYMSALALFLGSWLSGYFIVATNAFLQHPSGHSIDSSGRLVLADFAAFVLNPWAIAQYLHTMCGAVVTGAFVVAAVGAWYQLRGEHADFARTSLAFGTTIGLVAGIVVAFPTGDAQGKLVARHQPAALAAMEGRFDNASHAEIVLIGQPNLPERRIDNPIAIPGFLSFLAYGSFSHEVKGLDAFPVEEQPTNVELLYYSFHVMAGLGTLFIAIMLAANFLRWRGRLMTTRPMLWVLMLAFPFPFIANTAGWMTAELGRQPWTVYGILRTSASSSEFVHAGATTFTLLGFAGLYFVLGCLYLFMIGREIAHGPSARSAHDTRIDHA